MPLLFGDLTEKKQYPEIIQYKTPTKNIIRFLTKINLLTRAFDRLHLSSSEIRIQKEKLRIIMITLVHSPYKNPRGNPCCDSPVEFGRESWSPQGFMWEFLGICQGPKGNKQTSVFLRTSLYFFVLLGTSVRKTEQKCEKLYSQ